MGLYVVVFVGICFYALYEIAEAWNIPRDTVDWHRVHWGRICAVGIVVGLVLAVIT